MTDEELRDLVAETSRVAAENSRAIRETREESERRWGQWQESRKESERRRKEERDESERRWQEARRESERRWQEYLRQWQESREEILASRRETDRLITSLERRLGELGNAFGVYTQSMFLPSRESPVGTDSSRTDARTRHLPWRGASGVSGLV
jgi:transketolase